MHVILYVSDQAAAARFYATVLATEPRLDVPGMTELEIDGGVLGLMPERGIQRLLPALEVGGRSSKAELYLRVRDARGAVARAVRAGARLLSEVEPRSWGDTVGYVADPDGHVLAFAEET